MPSDWSHMNSVGCCPVADAGGECSCEEEGRDVVADVISGRYAQERINLLEVALSRIADYRTASALDPGGADTLEEVIKGIEKIALEALCRGGPERTRKVLTHLLQCSQCGQKLAGRACGPTHAILQADPWRHNRVQEILGET